MKRLISALLSVAALACLATASADTTAGTGADPLVSQTYADGEVYHSITDSASEKLGETLEKAVAGRLADANIDGAGGVITALSWRRVAVSAGGSVEARTGCEFSLASGSATVTANGTVLDLGAGRALTGAESLATGVKYFAAEDTRAVITAVSDIIIYVCGEYRPISGVSDSHVYIDVSDPAAWYYGDVYWAYENKLFYGFGRDLFYPDENCVRADMVYALWVSAGIPASESAQFDDVAPDAWYAAAIGWAQASGIVNGYGDGTFGPEKLITREQICAIFRRYAAYLGRDVSARADLGIFSDEADISDWAVEDVSWTVAAGLVNGMGNGKMEPLGNTTRAQVAALIRRLLTQ
ncbi:MAG: S-layer homology domain-containing protein [Oscillospiraceae bacterium]|nr:S-layer homology domain-containing protein [Oscillospiraceae bacterium]